MFIGAGRVVMAQNHQPTVNSCTITDEQTQPLAKAYQPGSFVCL